MSWRRIHAVLAKEWREARRNHGVVWTLLALAVLFVVLPLGLVFLLPADELAEAAGGRQGRALITLMIERIDGFAELGVERQMKAFLLRQLLQLFVILPIVGTMGIATFSIVGEKRSRSLEPLLATPVTTGELLIGKSLAAVLPSVAVTWVAFSVFAGAVGQLLGRTLAAVVFDLAAWLTMLVLVPLIAILAIAAGILVSSRSSDPRSAQQIGTLVLLPILAIMVGQMTGVFLLGVGFVLVGAVVLSLVDFLLLAWGQRLFRREQILVRWR